MALLSVDALAAGYPQGFDLEVLSLEVRRGEIVGLLGPNGSGKSTLLKALIGLLPLRMGTVRLLGRDVTRLAARERARHVAYVPQGTEAPFHATVREVVAIGRYPHLGPLGRGGREDDDAVLEALAICSLEDLSDRETRTLSGGERQRVLLARALAQRAPLLVLDEPVSNLDLRHQQETYERLRRLADEGRLGILLADHHVNLQSAYCDRLVVLKGGRPVAQGPAGRLVTGRLLEEVFGLKMRVETAPEGHAVCSWIVPPRGGRPQARP
jgi:iron complex transport system ATP-binding protein